MLPTPAASAPTTNADPVPFPPPLPAASAHVGQPAGRHNGQQADAGTTHETPPRAVVLVDVVVPVYNEERDLEASVRRLDAYLAGLYPAGGPGYRITIADNASTDSTREVGAALAASLPHVRLLHLEQKGRGRALRAAWGGSDAAILAYMDVDLSTGLDAFPALVAPLLSGHSDVAIGSRLASGAHVRRGPKREFISRSYNLLLHGSLGTGFSDAQCGFKAIRADVAKRLLPLVEDEAWFFDTELLVLAEQAGLRISEVAVDWVDDLRSSVRIAGTAWEDVKGVARLSWGFLRGRIPLSEIRRELGRDPERDEERGLSSHLVRFGAVGIASTLAYLLLFALLRGALGAQLSNFVALLVTAVANTAANRAFTFGVRGRAGLITQHLQGLIVFGIGWALTAGALGVAHASGWHGARELAAAVAANLLTTLVKFVLFRQWVFARPENPTRSAGAQAPTALTEEQA
ncbi:glycosyltransferase [Galactobacter valiniphilus]|uniref:glycosyltransferase n=1 Tax=Galactobacter valiniphilus TaxID=2676122 RepID=UPI001F23AAA8|nr:glycosyltransferase [Galactobacter valiniphilus]